MENLCYRNTTDQKIGGNEKLNLEIMEKNPNFIEYPIQMP